MWGELSILHVEHLSPPRSYYVGEATDAKGKPATDFLIGSESIGTERLPVVVESGASVAVVDAARRDRRRHDQQPAHHVRGAGRRRASCRRASSWRARRSTRCRRAPPRASSTAASPSSSSRCRPRAASASAAPRRQTGRSTSGRSRRWRFHVGLLLLFYFLPPRSSSLSLDLLNADSRLVKYLIEPPETVEEETPEWLDDTKMEDEEGGKGKRHKDEEGQMGEEGREEDQEQVRHRRS